MNLKNLLFKTEDDGSEPARPMPRNPRVGVPYVDEPVVDFDTTGLDLTSVVSTTDIYEKEGIADLTKSIFKVEEIKAVVPPELSTDIKRKTVLGMLSVSGLDIVSLTTDAELRVATLKEAQEMFDNNALTSIATDEAEIARLEGQIDALKQKINTTKKTQEAQNAGINTELNRIGEILKFVG